MWVVDLPMLPGLGNPVLRGVNRCLVTARLKRVLARLTLDDPLVLTTLPYIGWLIRGLRKRGLVYYCTDDYSHWPSADRETLQQAERDLQKESDLVLAASRALLARHQNTAASIYFPHGVDYGHFASAQQAATPVPEIAGLPRPRIGFFGLIYEKLDFQLLAMLARRFSSGSLVMIGPVTHCPSDFAAVPNVHLLGPKPYDELPRYIAGLDVLLLPYLGDDAMIRQSGPLKLRECLASGKPTVSVDVPEVRVLQPFVRVAGDYNSFLGQVEQALSETADESLVRARQLAVEQDSWERRAEDLDAHLTKFLSAKKPSRPDRDAAANRTILHLRTVSGKGGGPEKTLLNSSRHLGGGYHIRLAYIRPAGDREYDMPARARQLGVDFVDFPERGPFDPRTVWRLAREIKRCRPAILHAHDYKTNILAVLLGRWFRIPLVTTAHGYVTRGGRLEVYYAADRWALRRMDHIIAVSEDLYSSMLKFGIPAARCSLIDNAIDTVQYRRRWTIPETKQRLGADPARLVVGAAGRLFPEKGFDILIHAADQLLKTGVNMELWIAGAGEQETELRRLIAALGREERIRLLGHRSDLTDVYQALDVFALSSYREGLPNVLLEAMALEVPVVATRIAGIPRLIRDGENGLLVEPGDAAALGRALAGLLNDAERRERLGRAGRQTVEAGFSFSARMEKIRAIYDHLLGRAGQC
jgi:glycosyltransferase involved in cell wall biosynthesis